MCVGSFALFILDVIAAQITVGLDDDTEYEVFVDGKSVGTMTTGLGGKLSLSVELEAAGEVPVKIERV